MTRELLVAATEAACAEYGFAFRTGFGYRLASEVPQLPAAWLDPPKLESSTGREEGVKLYSVKLSLLDRCPGHTPDEKETCWSALERSAALILRRIGRSPDVTAVGEATFTPSEFTLTAAGELSLTVDFEVRMPFCAYCDAIR